MGDKVPGDAPQFIGRYRLVERIGKGAMGMVYAAEDESMGRRVAIKLMMTDLEQEPETRERFYREAKITSQLVHRNIVTVFDLGEDRGRPYLVMELLHGVPLGEHLQRTDSRTLDAKLDLMMQMCEGLQVAHERGVIHRDIKPNNLFVLPDGSLKILDFGVARLATSTLTASGFLVGTPEYMSPEQAMGRPIDARSDIFSAASVFYFMVTGRAPFGTRDLPKVLNAVMFNPPEPFKEGEAPEALSRVLLKALEKDPDRRYASCSEMQAEIENVRRVQESDRHRVANAALERYRQTVALIEERRALSKGLFVPDTDRACDEALQRLAQRFPDFARHAAPGALMAPMDKEVAMSALTALQARHNAELAAVAALREEAGDSLRKAPPVQEDLTLQRGKGHRDAGDSSGDAAGRTTLRERAAALFHYFRNDRGQSTTEWLMIAGILTGIGVFLLGIVPRGLGIFMRSMAMSLRTIAP
jgi:eukaryotic-like serine/threonine-protein kinase